LQKYSFIKRWFQEREYGNLLVNEIEKFLPDIVISANTPLDAQSILIKACKKNNVLFINWLQDIISIAMKSLLRKKIPIFGNMIGDYYVFVEKKLLRKSDHVVVIADDFEPFLLGWDISKRKISVIHNWAPLDELPVLPKENSWSYERELDDKFCFLYSGTLGMKHNPELILKIAFQFKENNNVKIVVVSEGLGAPI